MSTAKPSSSAAPAASRMRPWYRRWLSHAPGRRRRKLSSASRCAAGPLTRTTPMPPGPGGVAIATIVSAAYIGAVFGRQSSVVGRNHGPESHVTATREILTCRTRSDDRRLTTDDPPLTVRLSGPSPAFRVGRHDDHLAVEP